MTQYRCARNSTGIRHQFLDGDIPARSVPPLAGIFYCPTWDRAVTSFGNINPFRAISTTISLLAGFDGFQRVLTGFSGPKKSLLAKGVLRMLRSNTSDRSVFRQTNFPVGARIQAVTRESHISF
jgi:hypothetical protein